MASESGNHVHHGPAIQHSTFVSTMQMESGSAVLDWSIENFSLLYPDTTQIKLSPLEKQKLAMGTRSPIQVTKFWDRSGTDTRKDWKWCVEMNYTLAEVGSRGRGTWDFMTILFHWDYPFAAMDNSSMLRFHCKVSIVGQNGALPARQFIKRTNSTGEFKLDKFICMKKLWEQKDELLVNDTLRLHIELQVSTVPWSRYAGAEANQPISGRFQFEQFLEFAETKFLTEVKDIFHTGFDEHVFIICGGVAFVTHSAVLNARCNGLSDKMAQAGNNSRTLTIGEGNKEAMASLLGYVYTAKLNFPLSNVEHLLSVAQLAFIFKIEELKGFCFEAAARQINLSNAAKICLVSYVYYASYDVRMKIFDFCQMNWNVLYQDSTFVGNLDAMPEAFVQPNPNHKR